MPSFPVSSLPVSAPPTLHHFQCNPKTSFRVEVTQESRCDSISAPKSSFNSRSPSTFLSFSTLELVVDTQFGCAILRSSCVSSLLLFCSSLPNVRRCLTQKGNRRKRGIALYSGILYIPPVQRPLPHGACALFLVERHFLSNLPLHQTSPRHWHLRQLSGSKIASHLQSISLQQHPSPGGRGTGACEGPEQTAHPR